MRYLVIGDIHGNQPALATVFAAAQTRGFDACLFVGDLVGYGADPVGCIETLQSAVGHRPLRWAAGNHDRTACAIHPITHYNREATETLYWTRHQLANEPAARTFLGAAAPAVPAAEHIWLTHDSLRAPGSGSYHRSLDQAARELALVRAERGRIAFYGHTHVLRAEILDDRDQIELRPIQPHTGAGLDPEPLLLLPHETAWIGVGSVGLPVNRERQAEFLILDAADPRLWLLEKYAVGYPRYQTRARLHQQLLPACSAEVVSSVSRWL